MEIHKHTQNTLVAVTVRLTAIEAAALLAALDGMTTVPNVAPERLTQFKAALRDAVNG